ncbi:MAG: hypothetical protein JO051_15395 [Acidobacteriaceae bacterium]|nr:hypothetical protein [Acidobacteriaceae bacterium]
MPDSRDNIPNRHRQPVCSSSEERGFVSRKHAEAEEQRKAEKHKEATAHSKIGRQLSESKLCEKLAKLLPCDYPGFASPEVFGLPDLPFSPGAAPAQP